MRILILGGTGASGLQLIYKSLEVYPQATVVVYARSPQKLPDDIAHHASVVVVKGTLEELDKVEEALEGVDAVVSALGPWLGHPSGNPIATFYGHLIDLLHKHSIKRFLPLATPSHRDPSDKRTAFWETTILGIRATAWNAYAEIVAIGEVVTQKGADLDWTIVRVPFLTNGDTEATIAGYVGDGKTGIRLARKAYAAFCIAEIEKREWVQKAPFVTDG